MKVRIKTLWKVPVFCAAAGWISFYVTIYLGSFFFVVKTVGTDGVTNVSVDPVRSAVFNAVIFLAVLFIGGLWAFRSMTRAEIAASAGITSVICLAVVLCQLLLPSIPLSVSLNFAYMQTWSSVLSTLLLQLTDSIPIAGILPCFAPLLFILFGKKQVPAAD